MDVDALQGLVSAFDQNLGPLKDAFGAFKTTISRDGYALPPENPPDPNPAGGYPGPPPLFGNMIATNTTDAPFDPGQIDAFSVGSDPGDLASDVGFRVAEIIVALAQVISNLEQTRSMLDKLPSHIADHDQNVAAMLGKVASP